jgi:hypothetical protein
MARDHHIELGDHLVRLARQHLHGTVDGVWLDPTNAELRERRTDPAVLAEGDVVHVPDGPPRRFSGLLSRREHEIVLDLPDAYLRLALIRPSGVGYAAVQTRASFDGETVELAPDAEGMIDLVIGPETERVHLEYDQQRVMLRVAHLQPVDLPAGWHARLENLGYEPGPFGSSARADEYRLRSAIEEFQCDHDLEVDGIVGENTQAKLLEMHGA